MRIFLPKQLLTLVAIFGLLADTVVAAPPESVISKPVVQTNAVLAPPVVASMPQIYTSIGGSIALSPLGGVQSPAYFSRTYPTPLGGFLGLSPLGGMLYPGPIGGTMFGQMPPGGRLPNVIVTGGVTPGGLPNGQPPGSQLGSNGVGGIRSFSNSVLTRTSGVIVAGGALSGGAQTAGSSPGGVIIAGGSLGGTQNGGASPGGVIIAGGSAPSTNAPGGQPH